MCSDYNKFQQQIDEIIPNIESEVSRILPKWIKVAIISAGLTGVATACDPPLYPRRRPPPRKTRVVQTINLYGSGLSVDGELLGPNKAFMKKEEIETGDEEGIKTPENMPAEKSIPAE
jgi:hypothetical protein